MTTRGRKAEKEYRKVQKQRQSNADCQFCRIDRDHEEFVEEGEHFKIITNRFRYSYWDEQDVEEQVMLVPKVHTESIRSLPVEAAAEFLDFIGKYEADGYSIYARPPQSVTKTVPHQHTHLIKTKGKRKRLMIFSRKPFLLFMR